MQTYLYAFVFFFDKSSMFSFVCDYTYNHTSFLFKFSVNLQLTLYISPSTNVPPVVLSLPNNIFSIHPYNIFRFPNEKVFNDIMNSSETTKAITSHYIFRTFVFIFFPSHFSLNFYKLDVRFNVLYFTC